MPHAPCPMPHAPCPMPHAQCPMPKFSEIGTPMGVRLYEVRERETVKIASYVNYCAQSVVSTGL
jgi:hypothetical protein